MKKTPRFLVTVFICFLSTFLFAQVSLSNYSTYTLDVVPFKSQYDNILTEKDIDLTFTNLTRVEENGDLFIRVNFVLGLKSNYLLQTAIPGTGFAYRIDYQMPMYRVSIIDKNGILLLQKMYGGEKRNAIYGEEESIGSIEDLKFEWETSREEFYAELERQPEELPQQEMFEEIRVAVLNKAQELATENGTAIATGIDTSPVAETPIVAAEEQTQETRKRPESRPNKSNVNIYRRPDPKRTKEEDPSEPKLSTTSEQIFDLNGFLSVDACSKFSYQITNNHPFATLTMLIQDDPTKESDEYILGPGETKFFKGLPDKNAWVKALYEKGDFQEDQINIKEELNLIATDVDKPRVVTTLLDQFFEQVKPSIVFAPKFNSDTDEVTDYEPENNFWQEQLRAFLAQQTYTSLTKGEQNKIARETVRLLKVRALRTISETVEADLDDEAQQKLIYPLIKGSKNFKNITPLLAFEYSQSAFINEGINEFWNQQRNYRASVSFRLPFEWQLGRRKTGAYSTLNIKASFESLLFDFNQDEFQAYVIDPEGTFLEPEQVLPEEQLSIQTTHLSAGLAWKFYFPVPIVEIEGGAFYSHSTRLLWGTDQGQFPRRLFSPENEIIPDVVDLSSFRPYVGAKIGLPLYLSGYKFDCNSSLRNIHLFAGVRIFPVNFSMNENYDVFIRDAADIDFIPVPLQDGQSEFLFHLMLGGAFEF